MRHVALAAAVAAGLVCASARPARADDASEIQKLVRAEMKAVQDKQKDADAKDMVFRGRWNNGPYWETSDKQFSLRIVARLHLDTVFTEVDDFLDGPKPAGLGEDFDGATYFRRARLGIVGDLGKHVDYALIVDFADPSDPQFRDAYITIKNLKECLGCFWPSIRAGQQYEGIGLETLTSDNYTTFIERAGITNLHPERSIGLNFFDAFWKDRATAQLGLFSPDADDDVDGFALWDADDTDGGWAVTGRFTVVPWALDTCRFLHLGASASYRDPNEVRYRARPGLGRGPRVLDTLTISDPDSVFLWNAELGFEWNSFHASAEYTSLSVSLPAIGDPTFSGWYVQAGYFLTGEARAYDWKKGFWANTKPCCNFLSQECCCKGAFEIAARYDTLDLTDGAISGGELDVITVGLNWYLNPYVRIMFDYVLANVKNRASDGVVIADADVNSFLMRWDIHF